MTDREICELMNTDAEQGLYQLIEKYNAYVKSIVSRVLINRREDIEECVEDTFISIWENRMSLRETDSIKGLVACVSRNTAINRYRHLKKEKFAELECESLAADDEIASLIENIYQNEAVSLIVRDLKKEHKEIFLRRHVFMESIKEISDDMEMDERSIRNSLYRSKLKLRKSLEQGGMFHGK